MTELLFKEWSPKAVLNWLAVSIEDQMIFAGDYAYAHVPYKGVACDLTGEEELTLEECLEKLKGMEIKGKFSNTFGEIEWEVIEAKKLDEKEIEFVIESDMEEFLEENNG